MQRPQPLERGANILLWAGVLLIAAFGLAACSKNGSSKTGSPGPASEAPVTVALAERTNVPVQLESIGHVAAYSSVAVQSRVDGVLQAVGFKQGAWVQQGELIFTIDPRPFQATLEQARANLQKDEAQSKYVEAEARRNAALYRQKIVSQEISQESEAAAAAQQAVVAADQAAVTNAELQLSFCYIHCPINGRAGTLLVTPGNVVKNLDTVLVTIEQVQPIYVDFSMPESDLQSIRSRLSVAGSLPVQARAPNEPGPASKGDLTIINNAVDTNTGTIFLRGEFPNQDARLWPGQFVETSLTLTVLTNAVVVPSPAVQTGQQSNFVFVVQSDSTVETQPVELGESVGNERVINQGVRAGERVVVTGQMRLAPGTKVRIDPPPP